MQPVEMDVEMLERYIEPRPMKPSYTVLGQIGPGPPPGELEYVLGVACRGATEQRLRMLVGMYKGRMAVERVTSITETSDKWRAECAEFLATVMKLDGASRITGEQLLDLAQEYQKGEGREKVD